MFKIKHLYCLMLVALLVSVFTCAYAQDEDTPEGKYRTSVSISDWDCNTIATNSTEPIPVILYSPYAVAILNNDNILNYRKEQATSYTSYQGKIVNKPAKAVMHKPSILLLQKTVNAG